MKPNKVKKKIVVKKTTKINDDVSLLSLSGTPSQIHIHTRSFVLNGFRS